MEKEVLIDIKGNQYSKADDTGETQETSLEESLRGKLYDKNGKLYVTYEERSDESEEPDKVMLKINGSSFEMTRKGLLISNFSFKKGEVHKSDYITPFGTFLMCVTTKECNVYIFEDKINLHAVYDMEINDEFAGENEISIRITVI